MNYFIEYCNKIKNKTIIACKKIKLELKRHIDCINDNSNNWVYDSKKANRVINFIERYCCHVKGKLAGTLIKLELWEKAILCVIFGIVDKTTGLRKIKKWHLYIGRKNGKTLLAGCILLYMLAHDGEKGAEVYSAATKKDQAKLSFEMAKQIIQYSPMLRVDERFATSRKNKYFMGKFETTYYAIYYSDKIRRDCKFLYLSKNSKSLDGLNANCYLIDELHEIDDDNIIEVLKNSTKVRDQALEIITTTMGDKRGKTFDNTYEYDINVIEGKFEDETLAAFIFELDKIEEYKDEKMWIKSNPNMGVSIIPKVFKAEVLEAQNDPKKLSNLLAKSFNVRVTSNQCWLDFDVINNEEIFDISKIEEKYCVGGFDLSAINDLTAFVTVYFHKGKFICDFMYWCSREYFNSEENKNVPLKHWVNQKLLRVSDDMKINRDHIANYVYEEKFQEQQSDYIKIGYDPWASGQVIDKLEEYGYVKNKCSVEVRQGFKTLSEPMKFLEALFKEKRIIYQNNPITKWCLTNVVLKKDRNGNMMPSRENRFKKIDGAAALLNAFVVILNDFTYYTSINE